MVLIEKIAICNKPFFTFAFFMDNKSNLGVNIAKRRIELGLTQEKAAERIGLSRQAYSRIENGRTRLISNRLYDIANAFGCDKNLILMGYDMTFDPEKIKDLLNEKDEKIVDAYRNIEVLEKENQQLREKVQSQERNIEMLLKMQESLTRLLVNTK